MAGRKRYPGTNVHWTDYHVICQEFGHLDETDTAIVQVVTSD